LVTINLGKKDGIKPGQILTAVLIINLQRHPKLNFIINTEKEVLGKIKIQKIDDTISFGDIISEKDIGTIQKGNKIAGIEFVTYSENSLLDPQSLQKDTKDSIAFGESPKEWKPSDPPVFGKVGLSLGFGQMRYNSKLQSAGSLNGESNFYPTFLLTGQLWMTQNWLADIEIEQGVATIKNPYSGSSPGDLSANISNFALSFGYNFLIQDDFFGPSVLLSLGYGSYGLDVDSSSPLGIIIYLLLRNVPPQRTSLEISSPISNPSHGSVAVPPPLLPEAFVPVGLTVMPPQFWNKTVVTKNKIKRLIEIIRIHMYRKILRISQVGACLCDRPNLLI
jgi:hypothetical protein